MGGRRGTAALPGPDRRGVGRHTARPPGAGLVEDTTDRLAARLLRPLTESAVDELLADLELPTRLVLGAELLPFPNPIGLPRPV